jgi:hypothetical protein
VDGHAPDDEGDARDFEGRRDLRQDDQADDGRGGRQQ